MFLLVENESYCLGRFTRLKQLLDGIEALILYKTYHSADADEYFHLVRLERLIIIIDNVYNFILQRNSTHGLPQFEFTDQYDNRVRGLHKTFTRITELYPQLSVGEKERTMVLHKNYDEIIKILFSQDLWDKKFQALLSFITLDQQNIPDYPFYEEKLFPDVTAEEFYQRMALSERFTKYTYADLRTLGAIVGDIGWCLTLYCVSMPEDLNLTKEDIVIFRHTYPSKHDLAWNIELLRMGLETKLTRHWTTKEEFMLCNLIIFEKFCPIDFTIRQIFALQNLMIDNVFFHSEGYTQKFFDQVQRDIDGRSLENIEDIDFLEKYFDKIYESKFKQKWFNFLGIGDIAYYLYVRKLGLIFDST